MGAVGQKDRGRHLFTAFPAVFPAGRQFEAVASDSARTVTAASATACHTAVLRNIAAAQNKEPAGTGAGPDFFGLSHPTILSLVNVRDGTSWAGG